jgi:hypothetical protein
MIDLDDDRLAEVLASMRDLLVTQPADAAAPSVDRRHRPMSIIALAAAAAAVAVVSVSPLRGAVADWLGIGSTRIDIDPTLFPTTAPLPAIDEGLQRIDLAAAEQRLGIELPPLDTAELGSPTGYSLMPEGGILVIWSDMSTLWIHSDDVADPGAMFDKLVSLEADVQRVDDLGDEALAVSGRHFLYTPHRTVAATTAVLWRSGGWEYRLESDRDQRSLIAIARQLAGELV